MRSGSLEGFSRYIIYEDGSVWNKLTESYVAQMWNGGYLCLNLKRDDGSRVLEKVHRIVAKVFLEKTEDRDYFVEHKDGNRSNNHIDNLSWSRSKVYGVGINNPRVTDNFYKKAASAWRSMLIRCYYPESPYYDRYGGSGVIVSEEWKDFKIFEEWYIQNEDEYGVDFKGKLEVDKDILFPDNKIYSSETCILVPRYVNQFFKRNTRGGVSRKLNKLSKDRNQIPSKIYEVIEDRIIKFI